MLAAACSGGGRHPTTTTSSTVPVTTTTTAPPVYPLTGLPATDRAILGRPALIVKIDNAPEARPQSGLDQADVVIEERVEGGIIRFMAIFQSRDADPLGPVRSLRSTDPPVVTPIGGLFGYSGGIRPFVNLLHQAPILDVGVDAFPDAYFRRRGHPSPHELFTSTSRLWRRTPSGPGEDFAPAGVMPATHLEVRVGEMTAATWDWDAVAKVWRRGTNGTPHTVEGGAQLGFTNVILQTVAYRRTGQFDVVHEPVDEAVVVGSGDGLIISGAKAVNVHWSKPSAADVTTYVDAAGQPVRLAPGTTWVMLAPTGAPSALR